MLTGKHESSYTRGMNKLPLAKRAQILTLLCGVRLRDAGFLRIGGVTGWQRAARHRRSGGHSDFHPSLS